MLDGLRKSILRRDGGERVVWIRGLLEVARWGVHRHGGLKHWCLFFLPSSLTKVSDELQRQVLAVRSDDGSGQSWMRVPGVAARTLSDFKHRHACGFTSRYFCSPDLGICQHYTAGSATHRRSTLIHHRERLKISSDNPPYAHSMPWYHPADKPR